MRTTALVAIALWAVTICQAGEVPPVEGRDIGPGSAHPLESPFLRAPVAKSTIPTLSLAAPAEQEVAATVKSRGTAEIGLSRGTQAKAFTEDERRFTWSVTAVGRVATMAVQSTGAAAIRVGLQVEKLPNGLEIRVASLDSYRRGGPATTLSNSLLLTLYGTQPELVWTPVTPGDTQVIELFIPVASDEDLPGIIVQNVSHLLFDPTTPYGSSGFRQKQILSCEQNYSCASDPIVQLAGHAVAKIIMTAADGSTIGSCSGALINDRSSSGTPWFATASHCLITNQTVASSLQFFWYYELSCTGGVANSSAQTTVGAQYLLWDKNIDFSFVRVLGPLPGGLRLLGWNANPIPNSTPVFGVHHPAGYYKAYSEGTSGPVTTVSFTENDLLFQISATSVTWSVGITEPGSSGSPLMTTDGAFRGTLSAGPRTASCALPITYYAQFADQYSRIKGWIDPNSTPTFAHSAAQTQTLQPTSFTTTTQLGLLTSSNDDNWFRFSFPAAGYWVVAADLPQGANTSTFGQIYGSDGLTLVDSSANYPASSNLGLIERITAATTAYLRVTSKNGLFGPYVLYSLYEPDDPDGHAGLPFFGTPLSPNGHDSGTLVRPGDIDFFIIDLPSSGTLTIQTTGSTDTVGYLFDANINAIDHNDDASFPNNLNFLIRDALPAGRYYVAVVGYDVTTLGTYGISSSFTSASTAANYQGLWWRSPAGSESGWGINVTHQADTLFATWFTYDVDGSGMWLVLANGAKTGTNTYSGTLYRTTGPAFSSVPFDSTRVVATAVGSATLTFTDSDNGTFTYTVSGVTQTKPILREVYASPVPTCIEGGSFGSNPNYQALWWNSPANSEPGWGINITDQGDVIFATWFTYDVDGKGMWIVMANGAKTAPGVYSGTLYRTSGPSFSAFNASQVTATSVGNGTFTFTDASNGSFAYTVNGISQTKRITRENFATPASVCQ